MFDSFNTQTMSEEERRRLLLQRMFSPETANATVPPFKEDPLLGNAPMGVKRIAPRFNPGTPAWRAENPETPQNPLAPTFKGDESVWRQKPNRAQAEVLPPEEAAPALTGTRKLKAEAEEFDATPPQREKGFWRRLGSGALKGLRSYAEAGPAARELGIGGLIGAIGGGAISSAVSPKLHAEWSKERKSGQMWQKYGEEMKREKGEIDRIENIGKATKAGYDATKAGLEARHKAAEPYMDSVMKKGYLEPGEREYIRDTYGIDVADPKNGRFVTEVRDGKTYIRRINDPNFVASNLPLESVEVPHQVTVPGTDQVVAAKGPQALSAAATLYGSNANRAQSQSQFKERQATAAANTRAKALATKKGAETELKRHQQARAEAIKDGRDTEQIDAKIAQAERRKAEATTLLGEPRTEEEARKHFWGLGLTEAQIKRLIKKGRDEGVIK